MVNSKNIFAELNNTNSEILTAKNCQKLSAEGKGTVETTSCTLKDVLYVPELTKNLLSVNDITQNGGEVHFTKRQVLITENKKNVLVGNKNENGLYTIQLTEERKKHAD